MLNKPSRKTIYLFLLFANGLPKSHATSRLDVSSGVRFADQFTGADCGAKVMAADADLGVQPGEICVQPDCGRTITSAISVSSGHALRFVGGTWIFSQPIRLGQGSGLYGPPCPTSDPLFLGHNCPLVLKQADGANLPVAISLAGPQSYVFDLTLDGDRLHNTNTVGIKITGNRARVHRVSVQNFPSDGFIVDGSPGPPRPRGCDGVNYCLAEAAVIEDSESALNNGNGLTCLNQTDVFVMRDQFELNAGWGIQTTNCTGVYRGNDWSGNSRGGYKDSTTTLNFNLWGTGTFVQNSAASNGGPDFFVDGWNGFAAVGGGRVIVGNSFASGGNLRGKRDLVYIADSNDDLISSNVISCNTVNKCRYGINVVRVHGHPARSATVVDNVVTGAFAVAPMNVNTSATVVFAQNDENGGAQSALVNSALANNRPLYARTSSGAIQQLIDWDNTDNVNLDGDPVKRTILLRPDGSTIQFNLTDGSLQVKRIRASLGPALTSKDWRLGGGWGTGSALGTIAATDQSGRITITSGTKPGANPTMTLKFHDGTWTNPPSCLGNRGDTNTPRTATWNLSAISPTEATWTYVGIPNNSTPYIMDFVCMGK